MSKHILSCAVLCAGLLFAFTGCTQKNSSESPNQTDIPTVSTAFTTTSTTATSTQKMTSTVSTATSTNVTLPSTTASAASTTGSSTKKAAATFIATFTTAASATHTTTAAPPLYPYNSPQQILQQMTIEQKVAQMLMISCYNAGTDTYAAQHGAGALCLYANAFANKNKQQVKNMTANLQKLSALPLLIAVDEEGGSITRISSNPQLRASRFPSPSTLLQSGSYDAINSDTAEKAQLLLSLGVNVNLAPVCDIPLSKNDYIFKRCFSMDASLTCEYISRVVRTMGQEGIGSTLKHFPGYGGSADTHKGMGYDSRPLSDFESSDLKPFIEGIKQGADSVMVSHNIVKCMDEENPASLSPNVHNLLRNQLGFDGVIITDDLGMDAIVQFCGTENAAVKAVEAGNDLLCCPNFTQANQAILQAVKSGKISEAQINASVLRILKWKQKLSLFD